LDIDILKIFRKKIAMLSKAQTKNASRDRRRQRQASERTKQAIQEQREKWALGVIKWYCHLWDFLKPTAWMNPHKKAKLVALIRKGCDGRFENWCKADGYVIFRIAGDLQTTNSMHSYYAETSLITYEFHDENLGHFVLSKSGSFYELGRRAMMDDEEISLEWDKKHDFHMFHFLYGSPPKY
jgi:hypothetical protein